jgi:hypothetical protein
MVVDNYVAQLQDTSLLRNVILCVLSTRMHKLATSSSYLHKKMFQAFIWEASGTNSSLLDGLGKGRDAENHCL